ncbi:MAG: putative lipid II flippase FtsW [Thiomonas sp.]|nr:putative lipid II flippase FtsW [Thiomonas sp.]
MLERMLPFLGRKRDKAAADLPVRVGHMAPRQSRMLEYDQNLVWVTLLLLAYGLVMVYSATISFHDSPRYAQWSPYHYFVRDLFSISAALLASWIVVQIPMAELQKWSSRFFLLSLIGIVLVLLPHIGKDVNGSKRWVVFPGGLNFQPSELVKLTALLYAADFMVRKQDVKQSFVKTFLPMMAVMVIVGVLLLAEPDMGAFLVIASITLAILFLGGANGKLFVLASVAVIGAFVLMIVLSPWRRDRIFAYLNPWAEANALGSAYQLSHALIAMGRGECFGVGLGGSIEKLHYLPEAHTDFLLAIIGEELGLAGVGVVIFAFFWIVRRAFDIGRQALVLDRMYSALVAQGIGVWIGGQAFINIGVNLGLLPTKGLTLPLMSYGGSALLLNCMAIAVLLRVDFENRVLMRGGHV